jgi:hypothetical protein
MLRTLMFDKIAQKVMPKITNMLTDLDNLELKEVLDILKNEKELLQRIIEASKLINEDLDES